MWGYYTQGNADYGDERGFEISLRKLPVRHSWGELSGNINFTTQIEIRGASGSPTDINKNPEFTIVKSNDQIYHHDPILKASLNYRMPEDMNFLAGAFNNVGIAVDFIAIFPNDMIWGDYWNINGVNYMRPVNKNTNLKLSKEFKVGGVKWSGYVSVENVFNDKWLNILYFTSATSADMERFVLSGFKDYPMYKSNGTPLYEPGMYGNQPRAIYLGATLEL